MTRQAALPSGRRRLGLAVDVGVAQIAGLGVEAQQLVLRAIRGEQLLQPVGAPRRLVLVVLPVEGGERGALVADGPGAQEREDPRAHRCRELPGIPRHVCLLVRRARRRDRDRGAAGGCERLVFGVLHPLPLVGEARVHPAQHRTEVVLHLEQVVGLRLVGHRLGEHLVDAVEVAEQQALDALQVVIQDVLGKRPELLEHLPGDRLRADVLAHDPGVPLGERVERGVDELLQRLRVLELLEFLHALVVLHPLGLHLGHPPVLDPVELAAEDDLRVLEDCLDEGDDVEAVRRRVAIEQRDRLEEVERQRLVHREVVLQVHVDAQVAAVLVARSQLDDLPRQQRPEQLPRPLPVGRLVGVGFVAVADQPLHGSAAVSAAAQHVEQGAVRHLEARHEPFRRGADQALEGVEVPVDEIVLGRLAPRHLLAVLRRLLAQLDVLDHVFGRLHHHVAPLVEPLAAGAPGDLVEVARAEDRRLPAVELAETGEEDGPDRDVDADAQRVGAADDLQQSALRELLDEHAVLREEACVMQADAVLQPLADIRPVRAAEVEVGHQLRERRLLFPAADLQAGEVLRARRGFGLGEMDDVDGRLGLGHELLERVRERDLRVREVQRNRSVGRPDRDAGPAVQAGQRLLEERGVAQRGRHEQEPRVFQRQQRNLPGRAPIAVGVPVELVEHRVIDRRTRALAQADVRQDFRRAAQDWRVAIHRGVAGGQPDQLRAELSAERHPLLVDERLDRTGVDGARAARDRREQHGRRHQRLAGPGGRVQDDVLSVEQLEDGLLLRGVEGEALVTDVVQEPPEQHVARRVGFVREVVAQQGVHGRCCTSKGAGAETE